MECGWTNGFVRKDSKVVNKCVYSVLGIDEEKWNNPVRDWGKIIGQFMMFFEERFGEIRTA